MNAKKTITVLLILSLLLISAAALSAAGIYKSKANGKISLKKTIPAQSVIPPCGIAAGGAGIAEQYAFGSLTGTVTDITAAEAEGNFTFYSIETPDGNPATFVVSENTFIPDGDDISVGSEVTGFYNANAPMILIYPPQYSVDAVVQNKEGRNVKADVFDRNLVSSDNTLKLNLSDDTKIVTQDGQAFEGKLPGRRLIVFYGASTRSIPAQTTPNTIVVLRENTP